MFEFKWLWRNTDSKYRAYFLVGLCLSVVTSIMLLINPWLSKRLMDEVINAGHVDLLFPLLAQMMAVQLARLSMRYGMIICLERSSQNMVYNMRRRLFEVIQYQEMAFFDRIRTGDLMTRLSADLDWCRHFMAYLCYQFLDSVVMFVSTLIFFFVVDWQLTLCMVVMAPLLLWTTRIYSRKIRPLFAAMRERRSEMNTVAQENIAGNRVVRAFAREEYEKERFDEKNRAFRQARLDINKQWLTFFPAFEMLANGMTLIAIFAGALFMILGADLTFGEWTIFTTMSWALSNPMRNLGPLINDFQQFSTCAQKIMEVYYGRPLIIDRMDAIDHPDPKGKITFENVSFSYGGYGKKGKKVLEDISFEVQPGQTLAIMGPTGSGKTTLIQLLTRLYDVQEGSIKIDDCDIRYWRLQQLRRAVSTATQDVFLFSDTVEGNIAFGNQQLTVEEAQDFARRAAVDEFVRHMPEGYDTIIGERGVGLSGGQKQRVALARALAMRPAVLVLDDTTSALDMETERYIQQQLRELPFTCTKIIISGRISSVKDADLILVLQNGRITERGTHEELLQNRGYYWETYALQNDLPMDEVAAERGDS